MAVSPATYVRRTTTGTAVTGRVILYSIILDPQTTAVLHDGNDATEPVIGTFIGRGAGAESLPIQFGPSGMALKGLHLVISGTTPEVVFVVSKN